MSKFNSDQIVNFAKILFYFFPVLIVAGNFCINALIVISLLLMFYFFYIYENR